MIKFNATVTSLDLSGCSLQTTAITSLAKALHVNQMLAPLDLSRHSSFGRSLGASFREQDVLDRLDLVQVDGGHILSAARRDATGPDMDAARERAMHPVAPCLVR